MDKFLNAWIEIIANMKVEDIPSDNTLRDHLLRKIDGSQALHVDLTIFKGRDNDDKKKTYKELLEIMKRHIARVRKERNIAARDKFATDYANLGKPTTPAPKPAAPTPAPKDGKTGKPSAPAPKGKPGAPVLPSGNPKSHGKGKGKGGRRSRSPSTRDPSKTFCHFHFNKGNCKHGDKCQYSHSQYHWDKRKDKGGKGRNGRSTTPRRSQVAGGKRDHNCYGWLKGDCKKGDKCTFKHDPSMKGKKAAPSTKTTDAKATPALVREYDDDFIASAMPSEKMAKMDVKLSDQVDKFEYGKPDFVECSNHRPRRNMSKAQKRSLTCRSTRDIMNDQQWILQSKLGMTWARAIGILMDEFNEFSDVDEVHSILGPKSDIKLKINSNDHLEDNPRAEMCYEEVIPHVPGKYGRRNNIMCITMPIELKDRRFIMDSGGTAGSEWRWVGDHILERIHNIPRREMFVPSDCDDCPCDHRLIQDWRETQLKFQSNVRMDKSDWRLPGNNGQRSNNRNEFWTGKSIFRVLRHQEVLPVASCIMDDNLMACVNTKGLDIISPNKVFIPHTYRMVIEENKSKNELNVFADSLINLVLVRDNGQCMKYSFYRSIHDLDNTKFFGKNVTITMQELPESTPTI